MLARMYLLVNRIQVDLTFTFYLYLRGRLHPVMRLAYLSVAAHCATPTQPKVR